MVSSWPGGCGSKYAWSGKTFSENKAELGELAADLQSAVERFHSAAVSRRALGITISNPPGIENRTGHSPRPAFGRKIPLLHIAEEAAQQRIPQPAPMSLCPAAGQLFSSEFEPTRLLLLG